MIVINIGVDTGALHILNAAQIEHVSMRADDPERPGKYVVDVRFISGSIARFAGQHFDSAKAQMDQLRRGMEAS